MKCKGKGDYQDMLDSITRLKVLYNLSIKPYGYESLRYKTRIQRNRIRLILNDFVEKKMVIPHKYKATTEFPKQYDLGVPKEGLTYYILDLDNKYTLKWLRDIKLDTFFKDYFKFNALFPGYRYTRAKKMKAWQTRRRVEYMENVRKNKIISNVRIIRDMDPTFSSTLYLSEDQKEEYYRLSNKYSMFTRLKDKDPLKYVEYIEKLKKSGISFIGYWIRPYVSESDIKEFEEILQTCKGKNLCRFDFLVELSWYFHSRAIYIEIWNRLKEFE